MTGIDIPILVVGAGPVGLLGGQLLGKRGIPALIVEKHASRLEAPKAHALNPRSLEICAAAGLPMDRIHSVATPTHEGMHVRMVENVAKGDIGSLPYERQDDAVLEVTPWPLINIAQPRIEEIVEASVADLPGIEIRRGLEWLACDQLDGVIVSRLKDRDTGHELRLRSRYLIGADGAGSTVRDGLGIPMDGPEGLQTNMMIHFEADLRDFVGDRPAILYFLFGPGPNGVLIAYDVGKTWVLMSPCKPDDTPESFTVDVCRQLVESALGASIPKLKIMGARQWVMSAQVARTYRSGNAFLAGDAGHRFPPTGGLGLNTGIADIDNLCWKIAAVEKGWAGPGILESYEPERRTIAQTNMGQSLVNAMRIMSVFEALGYAPGAPCDPADFERRLSEPISRAAIDAAIADQKDHFDSLRLQLGYAYGDALSEDAILPISQFVPKVALGARLPHIALRDGRSTLNLAGIDGFTLLCGPNADAWKPIANSSGAPIAMLTEGADFEAATGSWSALMGLEPNGALLVRPDGHLLGVYKTAAAEDALRAVADYTKPLPSTSSGKAA
jgi:2-polyprenyl-6-methoxyphenol hydroxylase-like FAD-dependent oxidoreductase